MNKKSPRLSSKYNDSCLKMFHFIKLLQEGPVDYQIVIDLFTEEDTEGKSNPHVALNKYLNTLKIFGVKVKKSKNKFHMLTAPCRIDLDADDLKIISLLKETADTLPNGKNKTNFETFISSLEIRFSENTQAIMKSIETNETSDFSFCFSEFKEQIKKCEQYCQDNHKLDITYTNAKGDENRLVCAPLELRYQKRKVCLCVNAQSGSKIVEIPLDTIKTITQLPVAANNNLSTTTIIYTIKNRLAKNYRMREHEELRGINEDGALVIVNKNEDQELLLRRLMRYGTQCQVISPAFFKQQMIEMINKTLENYND